MDLALQVEDLGLVSYDEAHRIQLERLERRLLAGGDDALLLLEHPAVITVGRGAAEGNVLAGNPYPVRECERGGDVTLHLPGQLVGYVIRLLAPGQRDLKAHLEALEELLVRALARFRIAGRTVAGRTGVWVGDRKIASIGVACRRWCTWHGLALNVSCDLSAFRFLNPCGFDAAVMTSMERELGTAPPLREVKDAVAAEARAVLASR